MDFRRDFGMSMMGVEQESRGQEVLHHHATNILGFK